MRYIVTLSNGDINVIEHPEEEVTYEEMRSLIRGYLECIPCGDLMDAGITLWGDEEGKLKGLPVSAVLTRYGVPYDIAVGTLVAVSEDEENIISLNEEQKDLVLNAFRYSEEDGALRLEVC